MAPRFGLESLELKNKVEDCQRCISFAGQLLKAPVAFCGKNYQGVLLIGESPHRSWIEKGDAFESASGKRIKEYLNALGLTTNDVAFIECTKCLVSQRKNLNKMIANCSDFLVEQIEIFKPKMIISFGRIVSDHLGRLYAKDIELLKYTELRGAEYLPLYHPSPINPHGHKKNLEFLSSEKLKYCKVFK